MHINDCTETYIDLNLNRAEQLAVAALTLCDNGHHELLSPLLEKLSDELGTLCSAFDIYLLNQAQGGVGDAPTVDALSSVLPSSPEGSSAFSPAAAKRS